MHLLITGGCGFIGSNYIRTVLRTRPEVRITNLDALTYAGNLENLGDVERDPRYRFVKGDITDETGVEALLREGVDAVVNFAAESHVDRALYAPLAFIQTNVVGTGVLLEAARRHHVRRFLQVSTDEVYGSLPPEGVFTETTALDPSSAYSAAKAGADLLVRAYGRTFGLDVIVTRSSNNYGPYQHPEKFVPLFVTNALEGQPCPLYGDGLNVRDWLYVEDNARGIDAALIRGRSGEIYNLGAGNERTNLSVATSILRFLEKPESLIRFVKDRPGHDRRYALDTQKARAELGWTPQADFEEGLRKTIEWYRSNPDWIRHVKSGEYRRYYEMHYGRE